MPRVKQFDEELVLKKAVSLFWQKGFNATSVQDLVDHLGINRASLYDTFGDKNQLFDKAFQSYRAQTLHNLTQFFAAQQSIKKGFESLLTRAVDDLLKDPTSKGCFVVNITTELATHDPKVHAILVENKLAIEQLFLDFLNKGVESGEISPDKPLAALANLLFVLYNGLNVVGKIQQNREQMIGAIQSALSILD